MKYKLSTQLLATHLTNIATIITVHLLIMTKFILIVFLMGYAIANTNGNDNVDPINYLYDTISQLEQLYLTRCQYESCDEVYSTFSTNMLAYGKTINYQIDEDAATPQHCDPNTGVYRSYSKAFSNSLNGDFSCIAQRNVDTLFSQFPSDVYSYSYLYEMNGNSQTVFPGTYVPKNDMDQLYNSDIYKLSHRAPITTIIIIDGSSHVATSNLQDSQVSEIQQFFSQLTQYDRVGMLIIRGHDFSDVIEHPIFFADEIHQNEIIEIIRNYVPFGSSLFYTDIIEQAYNLLDDDYDDFFNMNKRVKNVMIISDSESIRGGTEQIRFDEMLTNRSSIYSVHTMVFGYDDIDMIIPKQLSCTTGGSYGDETEYPDQVMTFISAESTNEHVILHNIHDPATGDRTSFIAKTVRDLNFQSGKDVISVMFSIKDIFYPRRFNLNKLNSSMPISQFNPIVDWYFNNENYRVYTPYGLDPCAANELRNRKCNYEICGSSTVQENCANTVDIEYKIEKEWNECSASSELMNCPNKICNLNYTHISSGERLINIHYYSLWRDYFQKCTESLSLFKINHAKLSEKNMCNNQNYRDECYVISSLVKSNDFNIYEKSRRICEKNIDRDYWTRKYKLTDYYCIYALNISTCVQECSDFYDDSIHWNNYEIIYDDTIGDSRGEDPKSKINEGMNNRGPILMILSMTLVLPLFF